MLFLICFLLKSIKIIENKSVGAKMICGFSNWNLVVILYNILLGLLASLVSLLVDIQGSSTRYSIPVLDSPWILVELRDTYLLKWTLQEYVYVTIILRRIRDTTKYLRII